MLVVWIGMNDSTSCVLNFHELRCELRDRHGVMLIGDGYSWPAFRGSQTPLSVVLNQLPPADWVVFDDRNGMGYPRIRVDERPPCKVGWVENDYHNKKRVGLAKMLEPDVVFNAVLRPASDGDDFRNDVLCPFPVNVERFKPGPETYYDIALYGQTSGPYKIRRAAKKVLRERMARQGKVFLPTHGGYWRDDRGSYSGKTYYNDELAAELRTCKFLWVDGSDWGVFLQKYNEGIASGCVLLGEIPFGWEEYYSSGFIIPTTPKNLEETIDAHRECPFPWTEDARNECVKRHSIEARAEQIMEVLHARL